MNRIKELEAMAWKMMTGEDVMNALRSINPKLAAEYERLLAKE